MLTQTADHALRALLAIARHGQGGALRVEQVAELTGAPRNYLGKTLGALVKAGLLRSSRGPAGGFVLALPAAEITVARIVDLFSEPRVPRRCLLGDGPCNPDAPCSAHHRWMAMTDAARAPLDRTTLADLLPQAGSLASPAAGMAAHSPARPARSEEPTMSTVKKSVLLATALLLLGAGTTGCRDAEARGNASDATAVPTHDLPEIRGEEKAVITKAPAVPAPITRDYATKVIVELETIEVTKRLADGVDYTFWTFGGEVPGQFIRVREGDLVEFTLKNHAHSTVPHNIDLHAVTGPGGGAAATLTLPAGASTFSFRALNPGLYVYHCAVSPVPMHIANGMYGLILVEPKGGLPKVDRELYVMQSEFYAKPTGKDNVHTLDMERGSDERPTHVVFNGSVGAMTGDNAPEVKVGESVRLFVGNGGPNLVSSFHVIGEVFDNVYGEGGSMVSQKNVQTTLVPAGGAAIVEFRAEKPGTLVLVDHSIFRAFNKGALGMIKVTGEENYAVYKQIKGMGMAGH